MTSIKIKARHPLSKKERRAFSSLMARMGLNIKLEGLIERARVEVGGLKDVEVIIIDGRPILIFRGERVEPLLCYMVRSRDTLGYPRVLVDRGASLAVARGANLMLPGIRGVNGVFDEGDVVVIVDEESGVPIAVGRAVLASGLIQEAIKERRRGVAVKTLQRPGDKLWKLCDIV